MRQSLGSLAYIERRSAGRFEVLTQWNEGWQALSLIGGHKRATETFRECLAREVREELNLIEGQGFSAEPEPLARLEYVARSERANVETAYTLEIYRVVLAGPAEERAVAGSAENRWITPEELAALQTSDGLRVSPTVARVLSRIHQPNFEEARADVSEPS
jgi:8-oxo-dGTP pyrophosphatase MutT (NUDIX family)